MLVDHRLAPGTQAIHYAHVVLCLCREAGDLSALHDRISSLGIEKVGKNCRAVAASVCKVRYMCYNMKTDRT